MSRPIKRKAELVVAEKRHKCASCGWVIYQGAHCIMRPRRQNARARTPEYVHKGCATRDEIKELVEYGEMSRDEAERVLLAPFDD